jgi:phosphohistidine swiveling domain-containing protein
VIFVAEDISPTDMLSLRSAVGFGIDLGGATSHTAILARSMNVPAVLGLGTASQLIRDDDWLILDGGAGIVVVAPDETVLAEYRNRQAAGELEIERLRRLIHVPARTLDGVPVQLHANIEMPGEAAQALEPFCDEFLYTNVDTEGLMQGIPMDAVRAVRAATARRVVAAGGITTQQEVDELDAMGVDAVVGMAIYTGRLALKLPEA